MSNQLLMIKYNFLVKFNSEDVDDISVLNDKLKKIVGIVDTSLFYNIATKAIVAGENGVRIMECER